MTAIGTVDDGYSLTRYIAAKKRLFGELRFTFRPLLPTDRSLLVDRTNGKNEQQLNAEMAVVISNLVFQWNAVEGEHTILRQGVVAGAAVPLTKEGVLSLHPVPQVRLHRIVCYMLDGGDDDPNETDATASPTTPSWMKEKAPVDAVASQQKNS